MGLRARAVAPLFLLSGLAAVGCEAAWFRALRLLFGAAHQTAGVLLAAFMTGLALGAALGARTADRLRRPLRAYAAAEALLGAYALASPWLFALAVEPAARYGAPGRGLLALALLGAPTVAMGLTLPVLCAAVVPAGAALRPTLGALYAVNAGGGVAGALVAGLVLLPRYGVRATLAALGSLALAVAVGALVVDARARAVAARAVGASRDGREGDAVAAGSRGEWLAVAVACGAGVASFALQVAWNRVCAALLGAASYTFALLLATILAALSLGGAAARGDGSDGADIAGGAAGRAFWSRVSRRLLTLAIVVYLGTLAVHVAPFFLAAAARSGGGIGGLRVGLLALVAGLPSYQIGALFPTLASRFPGRSPGRAAGYASAAVTAGNIAGALGAGFVAIPHLGVQSTLVAVAAFALALACVAAARAGRDALRGTLLACAAGAWFVALVHPRWDRVALSAGSFRVGLYRASRWTAAGAGAPGAAPRCDPTTRFEHPPRVIYYREGGTGAVAVLGHRAGAQCSLYSLRINGKSEGSVLTAAPLAASIAPGAPVLAAGDYPTNVLLGLLPALAGPAPRRALLVGLGTGVSARALLDGGAARVEVVEIEPAVVEAAAVFDAAVLRDRRVGVTADDARVALRRAPPGSLDAIVSQPSNPWVTGSASLFSREYFALARARLAPGGRMLAWVQLYETDRASVRALVATFLAVFPETHAFRPTAASRDLLLLGVVPAAAPASSDSAVAASLSGRGSDGTARAALVRAGYADPAALLAHRIAGPAALARYASGAEVETDDRGAAEYRIADRVLSGRSESADAILAGL